METIMTNKMSRQYRWRRGLTFCVVVAICAFAVRSRVVSQSGAITAKPNAADLDGNTIYTKQEPVGWVFGRVVGFEGADKPMLRRPSFPAMNGPIGR